MTGKNLLMVGLLTVAGGLCSCSKSNENMNATLPTVRVVTSQKSGIDEGVRYSVSLLPNRQSDISFKSPGVVEQIRMIRGSDGISRAITMGDTVRAGEELAHVRRLDYQQKVEQSEAELRNAEAQKQNSYTVLDLAGKNFERASNLFHEQSLTKQDYDRSQQQHDSANAQSHQSDAGISNAKVQLAEAQLALRDTAVTAPFSGVIVGRHIELGNLVSNSTLAFTVADISVVKADFTIPEAMLSSIQLGKTFILRISDGGKEYPATVTALSPSADAQSRVFTAELTLRNPQGALKPGMIGVIELQPSDRQEQCILVPLNALIHPAGSQGFAVFVVERGGTSMKLRQQSLALGRSVGSNVCVAEGVSIGQQIVVAGAQSLHDHDAVRVLE